MPNFVAERQQWDDTGLISVMADVLDEAGLTKSASMLRAGGELSSWQQGLALIAMRRAVSAERERIAKIFDLRAIEHEKAWNNCASDGHRNAAVWRDKMYEARAAASTVRNA